MVTGRETDDDEELPCALMTQHLAFSLPYRALFAHGMSADSLPSLVDALVVLLVRLHLADFYWGDVSLSNVLFRRSAGGFAAYLVDAETGELRPALSRPDARVRRRRSAARTSSPSCSTSRPAARSAPRCEGDEIVALIQRRYDDLWNELTEEEEFNGDEMWRIQERIERLNDLGFDVDELDIVTDFDGDRIRIQPKVVELGHHRRELQALTGLDVEDAQARRLLNDIAAFIAHHDLGREDRVGGRQPLADRDLRADHGDGAARGARASSSRPRSSTRCSCTGGTSPSAPGTRSPLLETARDYIENVLVQKPDELVDRRRRPAVNPPSTRTGRPS